MSSDRGTCTSTNITPVHQRVGHHLRTYVRTPGLWAAPLPEAGLLPKLLRHALLGLCATCVSDCTSNSFRVIKTTRQTAEVLYLSP